MKQGESGIELVNSSNGMSIACDGESDIKVAAVPYLFCGGDGYALRPSEAKDINDEKECQQTLRKAAGGPKLSAMIEDEVHRQRTSGIDPRIDGRVRITRGRLP
jgi:hypothetical protein